MKTILSFFIHNAPFIYILLAVGLIFGVRKLVLARAETHEANYGLEREIAHHHTSQAITTLTLVGILAVAEFVLLVFLMPNLPALVQLSTPTMNAILAPTGTLSPEIIETLDARTPGITPTAQSSGCIPGLINISSPKAGDEIKGSIILTGDANIPNFGFYKYEFAPLGSDTWSAVEASRKAVIDGNLGNWDTSAILQGDYQLRLVVTDNQGNELPACVIPVRIKTP
jgi:hypothetical protein